MQTFVVVTFSGKGILFLMPSNVNYFARLGDKASASVGNTSQIHEHMNSQLNCIGIFGTFSCLP